MTDAAVPSSLGDVLPAPEETQTARAHAAARCLATAGWDATCSVARADDADWYLGETFAFRPAPGARAPVSSAPDALAAVLDSQQDTLDALEEALGLAAEFGDYGSLPQDSTIVLFARGHGIAGEIAVWTHPARAPAARPYHPARIACIAARLPLAEAQALGPGDMVVLTAGAWPLDRSTLAPVPTELAPTLAYDTLSGRVGPGLLRNHSLTEHDQMNDRAAAELTVPVSLQLSTTALTPEELDDLATGGSLLLGPVEEGLRVDLLVGGRQIGRGELVRLGDRFAVVLSDPASAQPVDDGADGDRRA